MTAKVFEFKRGDKKPHHRVTDKPLTVELSDAEIFQDVQEDIMGDWQRAAVKNRLSEYIASKLPSFIRGPEGTDYANDLNALSQVEQKLNLQVAIFYPGCTFSNPIGWLVSFHRGEDIFSTSSDMASEANARALNILLYLSFEMQMKSLGRI